MKKIVFTIEVIGLIAMLPTVIILQTTHVTKQSFEGTSSSIINKKIESTKSLSVKTKTDNTAVVATKTSQLSKDL